MKLVVPGGNGFIGSEICRIAVRNGHDVAAFGRTGRPSLTPARHPWVQDVEWRAADVFDPETWRSLLEGADAVIDCISTIREAPDQNVTFERANAESAILAAEEAVEADVGTFVFLSVQDKPPIVDPSFLAAKRYAERKIPERHPELRFVSLRPNLVFGNRSPGTSTLAAVLRQLDRVGPHPYATSEGRPLPVELVAAAAVHAAVTSTLEGTLTVPQIADLGRTSGLINLDDVCEASLSPLLYGVGGAALLGWLVSKWLRD